MVVPLSFGLALIMEGIYKGGLTLLARVLRADAGLETTMLGRSENEGPAGYRPGHALARVVPESFAANSTFRGGPTCQIREEACDLLPSPPSGMLGYS